MSVYLCAGCYVHYCTTCDSGEDRCAGCGVGPLCVDCSADHERDERQENDREEG